MPIITKQALSQFIRTRCLRQLRLNLSPDNSLFAAERTADGMPSPQPPRPGLAHIQQAGDDWQSAKLHDLAQTFGPAAVLGQPTTLPSGQIHYRPVRLASVLPLAVEPCFLAEAEFTIGSAFQKGLAVEDLTTRFHLQYSSLRPDLIEVLPAGTYRQAITAAGDVVALPAGDGRRQLRVIDIKLTAKASQSYFAEVAYYSMALAGWLSDEHLADRFVVVPQGAVWPGSHDASQLAVAAHALRAAGRTPTVAELRLALERDLEPTPFEVFAFRVRRFLREDVPFVLSRSWRELEWHVDGSCANCEYLGEPRPDGKTEPDHCMPFAAHQDHLSRVAFISRGARLSLETLGLRQVVGLAGRRADDAAFDVHQTLRATRTVVAGRAAALRDGSAFVPPESGTSAVMPRWADLHVYLSVDFDLGSAITVAFGLKAFWLEPREYGSTEVNPRAHQTWNAEVWMVDRRSLDDERRELLAFLRRIREILDAARQRHADTTVQFYLWDAVQYEHLTRVLGRHLRAILDNKEVRDLAWLFPPEELLPNAAQSTRRSPLTIVRDVVRAVLAAPVAHSYTLFEIARCYHEESLPAQFHEFNVHPLFEATLGDQVPSERAHEIWGRVTTPRHWQQQMDTYRETVRKRLTALETVTKRLEQDLRRTLSQSAPPIAVGPPKAQSRLSVDGQLWYAFAKLNEAMADLEAAQVRAMPPHEREAKFRSARLPRRLTGDEERDALAALGVSARMGRRVYTLSPGSREVKLRPGEFSIALAPENDPGFLDRSVARVVRGSPLEARYGGGSWWQTRLEDAAGVSVVALDRTALLIAVDLNPRFPGLLDDLAAHGFADLERDVLLDPVHKDYFTSKLLAALQAIGNPPAAIDDVRVRQATGQTGRGARRTAHTPPADFLWQASTTAAQRVTRDLAPIRTQLERHGLGLNPTQWQAWEEALTHRLRLIWGPPGTGKSRTVRAVVVAAVLAALRESKPIRVLLSASTYTAIDNVLLDVAADLKKLDPDCPVYRVRSYLQQARPGGTGETHDLPLNRHSPTRGVEELLGRLQEASGRTVVGAPPEQVHNLLRCLDAAQAELFDLIVIDEASQTDVAHAILPLCSIAEGGSLILAGDPLQLPPIHLAEPPAGLESLVGSIYEFHRHRHRIPEVMLDVNYRSNDTLVSFVRQAGYESQLTSYSPDLRLQVLEPLDRRPTDWPESLYWTSEWAALLDPEQPATCFVYADGRCSQGNRFEADAVAALLFLLYGRIADGLAGERLPPDGRLRPPGRLPCTGRAFWERAVGVVTPHRAQQGLIVSRLHEVFGASGDLAGAIRDAVDTVERFQGQQRDVMIASFALGDPDQIEDEDEFLMSLNRFNVMASRARAKLIVVVSREVIDHLAGEPEVLRESRLLKVFAESFCGRGREMQLGHLDSTGSCETVSGIYSSH